MNPHALHQPFVSVSDSAVQKQGKVMGLERVKSEYAATRQERGDQMERRVFGGGPKEDNAAIFNDG